jgi:uncharacterized membrane protein YphA (DoxX/SURF4 family)
VRPWLPPLDARRVALICGLIFVPAGLVKFVFYHCELHAFRRFGIPAPSVMEPLVGVLETGGGVLLARGVFVVSTAFVLAVIMFVAFLAGGLIHGSLVPSDTLAPALLVAMLYLMRVGLSDRAADGAARNPSATKARDPDRC